MILHLDVPTWTNAGGLIVLPALLLLIAALSGHLTRNRHTHQKRKP